MTVKEALKFASSELLKHEILSSRIDAEVILSALMGVEKVFLYANDDVEIPEDKLSKFFSYVERRVKKEPIAYIVGFKEFYGLNFKVDSNVLIPRPETEHLVQYIIDELPNDSALLDICTGSGCIPVAVKYNRPDLSVFFSDVSEFALRLARENYSSIIGQEPLFFHSDMFESIPDGKKFDFISANPPYIYTETYYSLIDDVRKYEPRLALDGGDSGLDYYRIILEETYKFLKTSGKIVIEIDPYVCGGIVDILNNSAHLSGIYTIEKVINDYSGKERVMIIGVVN